MNKKPVVLFFSRDYHSKFCPTLTSEVYDSIHVTLNVKEKKNVEERGGVVVACFEEMYEELKEADIQFPYLEYSIGSDRFIKGHSINERQAILKKGVTFWSNIFEIHKPNFIVHEVVALEISEIMFIEAKKRGIRYMAFGAFPVKKSFYWMEIPYHSSMKTRITNSVPTEQNYADARDYIEKINGGPVDNPFIKAHKLGKDLGRLKKLILHLLYSLKIYTLIRNKVIRQISYGYGIGYNFKEIKYYLSYIVKGGRYDKLEDLKDSDVCVFYPLHYEPEATLFYMSPYYENQFALIENLLKCLPEDQFLLVKEHPAQAGFLTEGKWKKLKARFPNLRCIKGEVPSKEIILRSKTVITLVSTAGFEATILGKSVIVLGKIYFDVFDSINFCSTFEEIYDLLRGKVPFKKSEKLEENLAKLMSIQNTGNPWPHSLLYSEQNIQEIRSAIEKETIQ